MQNIPFNKPSLVGKELQYILKAIDLGQLSGDGYFTKLCNSEIEILTGAKKALLTHSCTAALEMAAILCDLEPGDEVIMPSFTFVSTANAVVLRGAVPVFVDIDKDSLNIDPELIAPAISKRTKAIFAVHYAGFPADMDPIISTARNNNLLVVEDAAQALGSTYKSRRCGSLGDLAAFSFHETKNIISGEGGALVINKPELIERAEIIREKGTNRSKFILGQVDKYTWVDIGSSFLPGELIAAFLYAQLEKIQDVYNKRTDVFNRYFNAFSRLAEEGRVTIPKIPNQATGNGHMFYLLLRDIHDRDSFINHMRRHNIITPFHYIPLHSAPAGIKFGRSVGPLNVTTSVSERLVRIPLFFDLEDEIETVISAALDYF